MKEIGKFLMKKCGIYIITNLQNGKRYIGSSKNLYERLYKHFYDLENNKHSNTYLQNSWDKYGGESFIYGILEFVEENYQYNIEQYYIDCIKPEYNIEQDVVNNTKTKETKNKISNTLKERYKSGEIQLHKNDQYSLPVYIYDISTWTLIEECKTLPQASLLLYNSKSGLNLSNVYSRIAKDKYIVSFYKFEYLYDLKNYVVQHYIRYKNQENERNYLLLDNSNELIYFRTTQKLVNYIGCSSSSTLKKHTDATIKNPYQIKNTNYKIFFSKEFIPYIEEAVPIEESLGVLSSKNGEL